MLERVKTGEEGFTLAELLVTMTLGLLLGGLVLSSVVTSQEASLQSENTSEVMAQARVAIDRVTRDVRPARRLLPGSDARTVAIWLDRDSDGLRDVAELITYQVRDAGDGTGELVRWTEADPTAVQPVARDLVLADVFTYDGTPETVRSVDMRLQFQHGVRSIAALDVSTSIRLRNAVSP